MLIEIQELELHPVDFREEFSPGAIDLGEERRGPWQQSADNDQCAAENGDSAQIDSECDAALNDRLRVWGRCRTHRA